MKRVKQVRSALCSHRRTTTGRTRDIHGVRKRRLFREQPLHVHAKVNGVGGNRAEMNAGSHVCAKGPEAETVPGCSKPSGPGVRNEDAAAPAGARS